MSVDDGSFLRKPPQIRGDDEIRTSEIPALGCGRRRPAGRLACCNSADLSDAPQSMSPSPVSCQWLSPRDAPLPSFGARRARFPALVSTMRALRLPKRASAVAYWFAAAVHGSLRFRVRRSLSAAALPEGRTCFPGQGFAVPVARLPGSPTWTRMGSPGLQAVHPCALAAFLDPGRTDVSSP